MPVLIIVEKALSPFDINFTCPGVLLEPGETSTPTVIPTAFLKSAVEFAIRAPLRVVVPATVNAPPSVARPEPTVNVSAPGIETFPFNKMLPVPLSGESVIFPVVFPPKVNV